MEISSAPVWLERLLGEDAVFRLIQFIKYAMGGAAATATHIVVFHLLGWRVLPCLQKNDWAVQRFHLPVADEDDATRARRAMINNGGAFLVSNLVAYLINIFWVFQRGRHSFAVEILMFYAVSGFSLAIGTAIMGWQIRRHGIRTTYAFLSNLVTALLINYAMRKYVIFRG
jgi:putative flippase GtrA